jgi:hypothetical protein
VNVVIKRLVLNKLAKDRERIFTSTRSISTSGKTSMLDFQEDAHLKRSSRHITS